MYSVTGRINKIKQPRGGYLKFTQFTVNDFDDKKTLGEENLHSTVIGLVVDYLSRFMMGTDISEAFRISITGYNRRLQLIDTDKKKVEKTDIKAGIDIDTLLNAIKGLDDVSIISACKAVTYDVWYRNPMVAKLAKTAKETIPDKQTIENIRIMVERCSCFWEKNGPILTDGFTFETDGYSQVVSSGDGDFLTEDTLWDMKVSKNKPSTSNTLQILMYWIMGLHSGKPEFKKISKLGIFNPRLNTSYVIETKCIREDVIKEVEDEVICYGKEVDTLDIISTLL